IEPARALLGELGYGPRVHLEAGDGSLGWAAHAPYRAILAAAAPAQVPQALKDQLAIGGRLVLPVGTWDQDLVLIRREGPDEFVEERVFPVRFVPMTGAAADYVE
ncbi:MAG: protein-L-isoaspartate O-methyltransferase, partial [Myxococcales bacterium]|nr:protein-L-isoaspartate O-methyltransferase [Myxococcales bacterium]